MSFGYDNLPRRLSGQLAVDVGQIGMFETLSQNIYDG